MRLNPFSGGKYDLSRTIKSILPGGDKIGAYINPQYLEDQKKINDERINTGLRKINVAAIKKTAPAAVAPKPAKLQTPNVQDYIQPTTTYPFQNEITKYAKQYGIHPRLLDAIISTETASYDPRAYRFEPKVYSNLISKGLDEATAREQAASYGLGQTMGMKARELGLQGPIDQLYDPNISLDYTGRYIADQWRRYSGANWNDPATYYRAYNGGNPNAVIDQKNLDRFLANYAKSKQKYK